MNPIRLTLTLTLAILLTASSSELYGQSTSFTYQGRLDDGSSPANGSYDFRFALFAAGSGGGAVAGPVTNTAILVSNGLFTVALDFGGGAFTGAERWLEIGARTSGGGAFTTLAPRQPVTSAPYAILARGASNLLGTLGSSQLSGAYANPLTFTSPANSYSGNGAGLTALNASQLTAGTVPDARLGANVARVNRVWLLEGNAGTTAGTHFLGTTDNQPVEIKVNGLRALRLEFGGDSHDIDALPDGAPNVIGGSPLNFVSRGIVGATIGGGGAINYFGSAHSNTVIANFSTIGGGMRNTIQTNAVHATIGGGDGNTIEAGASRSTIGGGLLNIIHTNASGASIGGGSLNVVHTNSAASTIGGGSHNTIQASASVTTIGGGSNNRIQRDARAATISGGYSNDVAIAASYATIGGGELNTIDNSSTHCTIGGGTNNTIGVGSLYSTIGGGFVNTIDPTAIATTIAGGSGNTIGDDARNSVIGGGAGNTVEAGAFSATIPGGVGNTAMGDYSFAAGRRAKALSQGSFVWADSQNADFNSPIADSVFFRCQGGVRFTSGDAGLNQTVSWLPGFASWSFSSDRDLKEAVTAVDTREVLDKVARLPMNEWNFKGHSRRHIGPMAQDFHAQFPLNDDDKMIDSGDLHGVALAAIQGLNQKLEEEIQAKAGRIDALEKELSALKSILMKLNKD